MSQRTDISQDLPKGVELAFEVENVDGFYQCVRAKKLPIKTELGDFNWDAVVFLFFSQADWSSLFIQLSLEECVIAPINRQKAPA